ADATRDAAPTATRPALPPAPSAGCQPSPRRDPRHRAAEHAEGRLLEDHVLRAPRLVGHGVALLEIAARAEGAVAGAGEHDRAHVRIALESIEARQEVLAHRGVHRVHLLGPVEGHRDDARVVRARDERVAIAGEAHWLTPLPRRLRTSSSV